MIDELLLQYRWRNFRAQLKKDTWIRLFDFIHAVILPLRWAPRLDIHSELPHQSHLQHTGPVGTWTRRPRRVYLAVACCVVPPNHHSSAYSTLPIACLTCSLRKKRSRKKCRLLPTSLGFLSLLRSFEGTYPVPPSIHKIISRL